MIAAGLLVLSVGTALILPPTPVSGGSEDEGDLFAEDSVPVTTMVTETTDVPLLCTTSEMRYLKNGRYEAGSYIFSYVDRTFWRYGPATGQVWVRSKEVCERAASKSVVRWSGCW